MVGQNCRKENSHLYNTQIQRHWTPILEITRQFKIGKSTNVKVLRRQFPLRPAAAKTIHHCQGDTLDESKQLLISQIQPESTCTMLVLVELETLISCIF